MGWWGMIPRTALYKKPIISMALKGLTRSLCIVKDKSIGKAPAAKKGKIVATIKKRTIACKVPFKDVPLPGGKSKRLVVAVEAGGAGPGVGVGLWEGVTVPV